MRHSLSRRLIGGANKLFFVFSAAVFLSGFFVFVTGVGFAAVQSLTASSLGNYDQWGVFPSLGDKITAVNSNDGDTSYISTDTDNAAQTFGFDGAGIPAGSTVNSVTLYAVAKRAEGGAKIRLRAENGTGVGQQSDGLQIDLPSSYSTFSRPMMANPFTGNPWTVSEVNDWAGGTIKFGVLSTAAKTARVTQLYIEIDYSLPTGKIIIVKNTIPDDPQDFNFNASNNLSPSSFQLDDDNDGTLSNNKIYQNLSPDTYTITEDAVAGFDLTDIVCNDPTNNSLVSLENRQATIVLDNNEEITCTFTNTKQGKIIVDKVTDPPGDPQSFEFTTSYSGSFNLTDADEPNDSGLLPAGQYSVDEIVPLGWRLLSATCDNGNDPSNINLDPGETVTCTFTNEKYGQIRGRKFEDLNGDGIWDQNEPPLENWTIYIDANDNGSFDQGEIQTQTDAQGNYAFTDLAPGDYVIREIVQNGWNLTMPTNGKYNVALNAGGVITDKDFGNFFNLIIGYKFNDLNGDGIWLNDGANPEPGLQTWTIKLFRVHPDPIPIELVQTSLTSVSGQFTLSAPSPGQYRVMEESQLNWNPSTTSFFDVFVDVSGQTISHDSQDQPLYFGNYEFGRISGIKYEDVNGDGEYNNGEPLLENWEIILTKPDQTTINTFTDQNGYYEFSELVPGLYQLSEILQSGWMQTEIPGNIVVTSGLQAQNKNFGNFRYGKIEGIKFEDLNDNGQYDNGEPGIAGWTIYIDQNNNDSFDQGEPFAHTDAQGNYSLMDLGPGPHRLREVLQPNWVQTFPINPDYYDVALQSNETVSGKDFGNFESNLITGYKWNDLDGDGVWDNGEPPLANWQIELHKIISQDPFETEIISTDLTDADGSFRLYAPGATHWRIKEQGQNGWIQTAPQVSSFFDVFFEIEVVQSGKTHTTDKDGKPLKFGNYKLGQISGMKFEDLNKNGKKNNNEPGLAGWQINLIGFDEITQQNVNLNTITDVNGNYSFTDLKIGNYTISETPQAGWTQTMPVNPNTYSVRINQSGDVIINKNFGNYKPGVIRGKKYKDVNRNGVFDNNDVLLPGWVIELLNFKTGRSVRTTTDQNGEYRFENLDPARYRIREILQPQWIPFNPKSSMYDVEVQSSSDFERNFGNIHRDQLIPRG